MKQHELHKAAKQSGYLNNLGFDQISWFFPAIWIVEHVWDIRLSFWTKRNTASIIVNT